MGRNADDGRTAEDAPRINRLEVLLSHMHAVGARQQRDISAIVHDHAGTGRTRERDDLLAHRQEGTARGLLAADLDETGTAGEVRLSEAGNRPACGTRDLIVDDGVQRRTYQTASARFFFSCAPGGAKRSMNLVLNRPARKSGSLRMRRFIGIVVLTPSCKAIR